ncbi:MAG: alpha/beta fold hydrolase [Acidimicrobiales bacterium]
MTRAKTNGIEVEYEITGEGEPLLLIMGLGAQLLSWRTDLRAEWVSRGFQVIAFDNRDVGLSTKIEDGSAYTLWDMAADAAGLLDVLRIDNAHVVGASMGGMIAQSLAIRHPERVRSLTSIMSTTGDASVGQAEAHIVALMLQPAQQEREARIAQSLTATRAMWGDESVFPFDEASARELAEMNYDRSFYPAGVIRQLQAIMQSGDRTEALRELRIETLVVHGDADPLVTLSGGEATAAAIPGAEFIVIPGMGHSLPRPMWPTLVEAVAKLAARA